MKLAVVGGRTFNDYGKLEPVLDSLVAGFGFTTVVSGGADGADTLGEKFADERGLKKIIHLPDYKTHGRAAPMIRNRDIINDADFVVAFWDGESRGTKNAMELTAKGSKPLLTIYY